MPQVALGPEGPPAQPVAPVEADSQKPTTAAPPLPPAPPVKSPSGPHPPRVAVLTYHDVYRPARGPYSVTPERLENDLNWLLENGWQPLSLAAFRDWMQGKRTLARDSFLLTFDDGYSSFLSHALPVLQRMRVPAVLFVISNSLGPDPTTGVEFLTSAQIATVARSGLVSVESHTHDLHYQLPGTNRPAVFGLKAAGLGRDLDTSARTLQDITGRRPEALAWPHGSAPDWAVGVARERFALVFTGDAGMVEPEHPGTIRRFPMEWRQPVHLERSFGRR